ncbi:amidoligase family protein [uncultured Ruminococcus sp.]|uniref:amidoligase family protein n=1 Tax=uncultured Ruminococcus sp. TaxID=165186 RepID=UPI0015B76332|nr:amidoligase family protein [uncultured Ruminococcus sp.]
MAIDLKDQTFGVEIEFTGITREQAANVVAEYFGTRSSYPAHDSYYTRRIPDDTGRTWKLMRDSSIDPDRTDRNSSEYIDEFRCELVTPILKSDKDMDDLQQIVRNLRKAGMKTNNSCGLHVHIGAERHDAQSLTRLSKIMYQKEDILYHALNVSASREMRWCRKTDDKYISLLTQKKPKTKEALADIWYRNTDGRESRNAHYNGSRYKALNLHSYFTKGTVEFRCFNSTNNAGRVRTYVRFAQAVSAQALNQRSAAVHKTQSSNECYTFRTWLIRIGLNGDEFKVPRKYLLERLEGAKDWKDKAAAMERRRLREQQAMEIAARINDMRQTVQDPSELTIRNIISATDREPRNDNTFTLREQIVMLLENVRDDDNVTADERNSILSVLGVDHNGQNNTIDDLLSVRRQPQTSDIQRQSSRRRNTPSRNR